MANNVVSQVSKFKQGINKKVLLGLLSMFMCLGVIIICSFIPFIIDPSRWQTNEFLTDELIISAVVIMSMISLMFIGQAGNARSPDSKIAKARVAFFGTLELVTSKGINAFRQWVKKVLEPEDIKSIKERRVRKLGIDDITILELDNSQLKELYEKGARKYTLGSTGETRYYKAITKEQYDGLLEIKKTEYKIKFVEPEYYLSVKNLTDSRTISERAVNEGKKKSFFLGANIFSKLFITIASAMIFASLVRDMATEVDQAAAWAKFISRLWAMVTSSFMGYLVGNQMNDIDAEYIEMRTQIHKRYLQDKEFKPLSQQEEAKQEFIETVRQENILKIESRKE